MGINLLTLDLGSPANIGTIIRQTHVLGGDACKLFIFDPRGKLVLDYETIRTVSIGLVDAGIHTKVDDLESFLRGYQGRVVGANISPGATPLFEFEFKDDDLIVLGNENTGFLDKELRMWKGLERIGECVIVPMLGKNYSKPDRGRPVAPNHQLHPNLSVAATAGIIIYAALQQLGYFKGFSYEALEQQEQ